MGSASTLDLKCPTLKLKMLVALGWLVAKQGQTIDKLNLDHVHCKESQRAIPNQ